MKGEWQETLLEKYLGMRMGWGQVMQSLIDHGKEFSLSVLSATGKD